MKTILPILLLFVVCLSHAQTGISGYWRSEDSSRVYKIYATENGFEAVLAATKRANEQAGAIILSDVQISGKQNKTSGLIHAVSDNEKRPVKIELTANGSQLKLIIPRMLIAPVTIKWIRLKETDKNISSATN